MKKKPLLVRSLKKQTVALSVERSRIRGRHATLRGLVCLVFRVARWCRRCRVKSSILRRRRRGARNRRRLVRGRCLLLGGRGIGIRSLLLLLELLRHTRSRWQLGCFLAGVGGRRVVLLRLLLMLLELLVCGGRHLAGGRVRRTLIHGRIVDGCS